MISPDDLRIPVDPEGMKGPGSSKCHGFLGNTKGLRGLVFLWKIREVQKIREECPSSSKSF